MPDLAFEDGAWSAKCQWHQISKEALTNVYIANSQAEDGPDDEQYQVLAKLAKMKAGDWKKLRQAVERWIAERDEAFAALDADDEDLAIDYLVIPKQYPALLGAFAVVYQSDWELEHGIEVIVLPGGEKAIASNDRVAFRADWPTAIGRACR